MIRLWTLSLSLLSYSACADLSHSRLSENELARIVNAIYKVEGGDKTSYPYGIKIKDSAGRWIRYERRQAESICRNTVRNNNARWQASGETNSFIAYLGLKYCPPSADPIGYVNWTNNMTKFLLLRSTNESVMARQVHPN